MSTTRTYKRVEEITELIKGTTVESFDVPTLIEESKANRKTDQHFWDSLGTDAGEHTRIEYNYIKSKVVEAIPNIDKHGAQWVTFSLIVNEMMSNPPRQFFSDMFDEVFEVERFLTTSLIYKSKKYTYANIIAALYNKWDVPELIEFVQEWATYEAVTRWDTYCYDNNIDPETGEEIEED